MPKHQDKINTPEAPDDAVDAKSVQKWQVWTQGPKDAKETKRKFKLSTPGQDRDYKKFVSNRRFQKFEEIEPQDEDVPANSVAGGGVDMAPNASGTRVFMKRKRSGVDGRTREYRATQKRIKERNAKTQEREAVKKLSQFGVTSNPFQTEQNKMDNNKYLKTKEGSIEQAAIDSVSTEIPYNPNNDLPTLTLPKNRYLNTKEESLEWSIMKTVSENDNHPPKKSHKLPRQLKDPKKEKMVGTKSGTKVVDRDDPKYKNAPEHESVELDVDEAAGKAGSSASKISVAQKIKNAAKVKASMASMNVPRNITVSHEAAGKAKGAAALRARTPVKHITIHHEEDDEEEKKNLSLRLKGKGRPGKGSTSDTEDDDYDRDEKRFDKQKERKRGASSSSGLKKFKFGDKDQDEVEENSPPKGIFPKSDSQKHREKMKRIKDAEKRLGNRKESKETEAGERDMGSDEYANYVKTLTPGEKAETDVVNRDARKTEVKQKKEKTAQNHQATRIDDDYDRSPDKSGDKTIKTPDSHMGVKVQKLKPSLKGMSKAGKLMHKLRQAKKEEVKIDEDRPKWGSQLGDSGPKKTPHSQFGDSPAEIKKNKKKYFDWQKKKQKEEVEVDEVNKHQARAFGSALIRDKSPLDSPKAKAAREKLQKVMKDIKKKDPDHPAVQGIKDEVELTPEALDLQKVRAQRRAQAAKRMKDVEKVFNKKTKPSKDMKVPPRMDDPDRGYFEEVEIDELSNKTMDSYAKKASASQADAEKKQDYKTADKRIAGKLRATRRKFSNDTNKILDRLKNNTTTEEMDFKVKLKGLPSFYVPGKSAAAVRMMLRRQVKRPDDIESVDRVTKSSKRKDFRLRGQGKDLSSKDDD